MNIYVSFFLFSLIILLYWVISELFTILFRFTGMPDDKARFQVTSLLTGCGFTTRESELLLTSQTRRRLARITMLFGYVFNITIVSAFINVFLSLKQAQVQHYVPSLLEPLAAIAIIFVFMRVPGCAPGATTCSSPWPTGSSERRAPTPCWCWTTSPRAPSLW